MSIPTLIIAYCRVTNVLKLITDLHSQNVTKIYLAIDGAKLSHDNLQSQIEDGARALATRLNIDLKIWRRDSNLGPAVSVITAIDWFFSHEYSGVIIEDDLILSSDAISFFESSLSRFADVKNVFLVTGSNYFEDCDAVEGKLLATHYPVIWGWASWRSRWEGYRNSLDNLHNLDIPLARHERWYWKTGLRRCMNGITDAWDIPLVTYQLSHDYISIISKVNLISNCGADSFAGNTFSAEWPLNLQLRRMTPEDLVEIQKFDGVVDENLIRTTDSLFRQRVYRISWYRSLPPVISKLFDLFRYPPNHRERKLIERISRIETIE